MARNGSGTYSLPAGNPVTTGAVISSTWANNTLDDLATAMTASIAKDGQTTPTANLPMGTYRHTGVGAATATTDYARADQTQNSSMAYLASVAGTDTITATATPTPAAYAAGQTFRFVPANNNTGAATINISSLGAKSITKNGTTALAAADLAANKVAEITYDGTQFQLINPAGGAGTVTTVSVVSANGLAGSVANATTTPAITLTTSITGVLKGNGTAISAASAGTDYVAPGAATGTGITMATSRLLGRTTASSGAIEEISVGTGLSLSAGALTATGGASALTLISTQTAASSASVAFTGLTSTYEAYLIVITDYIPGTDNTQLQIRTSTDNGSTYDSGANNYFWMSFPGDSAGSNRTGSVTATSIILNGSDTAYNCGTAAGESLSGMIMLSNPLGTAVYKQVRWELCLLTQNGSLPCHIRGMGVRAATADVDAIQFISSSGNLGSGKFRLYGISAS